MLSSARPCVFAAPQVNTFYNLVTDFYEWGWGTSFHFSPQLPGKTQCAPQHHDGQHLVDTSSTKPVPSKAKLTTSAVRTGLYKASLAHLTSDPWVDSRAHVHAQARYLLWWQI